MSNAFIESYRMPVGRPGRYLDGSNYSRKLHGAVGRKWPKPEEKEWWYKKYRAALRKKTARRFYEQGGLCFYCHNPCFLKDTDQGTMNKKRVATAEHVIPLSKGGTDHLTNLVMACSACNSLRGDMKFSRFIRLRQSPERWSAFAATILKERQGRQAKAKAKRAHKGVEMMWKIATLLIYCPEARPIVKEVHEEFIRRRKVIDDRIAARKANSLVDESDILK